MVIPAEPRDTAKPASELSDQACRDVGRAGRGEWPPAEAGELIRRQLGNKFGDFFDFHVAQYSTAEALLSDRKGLAGCLLAERAYLLTQGE